MRTKRCKSCGEVKHVDGFAPTTATADGLQANCKQCQNATRKFCPKCGRWLERSRFHRRLDSYDGLQRVCAACNAGGGR